VSLAMLLAVARSGSSCGLLLLDEVDAALDEHNQGAAAALLRQLAHDAPSACQVLCATHNAGFQAAWRPHHAC
jgi:chromosome segregation ATPase